MSAVFSAMPYGKCFLIFTGVMKCISLRIRSKLPQGLAYVQIVSMERNNSSHEVVE
jgi:hypothetical protein